MELAKSELIITQETLAAVSEENQIFQSRISQLDSIIQQQTSSSEAMRSDIVSSQEEMVNVLKASQEAIISKQNELAQLQAEHSKCDGEQAELTQRIQALGDALTQAKQQLSEAEEARKLQG